MSSRSSNPRSSRSATPPRTRRKTGSQPRSIGVSSAIRSGRMCDLRARDQSVADNAVAGHQARNLSGGGGHEWLVQHDLDSGVSASRKLGRQVARNSCGPVAQLDTVDGLTAAIELNCLDKEAIDCERLPGSDGDTSALRVLADDVEGRAARDAHAAALSDREAVEALMLGEDGAVERDDLAALGLGLA